MLPARLAAPRGGSWVWGAGLLVPWPKAELGLIWGALCRPSMFILGLRWPSAVGLLASPGSPWPSELGSRRRQGLCSVQTRLGLCRSLRAECRQSPGSVRLLDGGRTQLGAWPPAPGTGPDPAVFPCVGATAPAPCVRLFPPREQGAAAAAHGLGVRCGSLAPEQGPGWTLGGQRCTWGRSRGASA